MCIELTEWLLKRKIRIMKAQGKSMDDILMSWVNPWNRKYINKIIYDKNHVVIIDIFGRKHQSDLSPSATGIYEPIYQLKWCLKHAEYSMRYDMHQEESEKLLEK